MRRSAVFVSLVSFFRSFDSAQPPIYDRYHITNLSGGHCRGQKTTYKQQQKLSFAQFWAEVQNCIKHSIYPYIEIAPNIACVLYQRDIRDIGAFGDLTAEEVDIIQNKPAVQNLLDSLTFGTLKRKIVGKKMFYQ